MGEPTEPGNRRVRRQKFFGFGQIPESLIFLGLPELPPILFGQLCHLDGDLRGSA
jgi:hypothetical protein